MAASQTSAADVLEHAGEIAAEFVATKLALVNMVESVAKTSPVPDTEAMAAWAVDVLGHKMEIEYDSEILGRSLEIEGQMWKALAQFCELRAGGFA